MSETSPLHDSLRREIGQHFIVGFVGQDVTDEITRLIRDFYVGAIIIMKRNIQDAKQLRKLIADLQTVAKESGHTMPLLIGIDQENGLVSAFTKDAPLGGSQFPGAMALGATGDPDLAELVNATIAREMRLAGINWAFSPVCDLNSDPHNPIVGVRAFGDDPQKVSKFVVSAARGLTLAGIAPSPKHFPGHGDTNVDSHLGLPRVMKRKEQLEALELVPFKQLIDQDVATVMTIHMALPLITGDERPCSLSRKITTDLLRDEMAFKGVIVTDCLEMDAVIDTYGTENGAVEAIKAGADIAMICHRFDRQKGAIQATYEAVQAKTISWEELKLSSQRIIALKERFAGSWDDVLKPDLDIDRFLELKRVGDAIQRDAYAKAIAVIRDDARVLPLSASCRAIVFTPRMESLNRAVDDAENVIRTADGKLRNTAGPSYVAFANSVSKRVTGGSKHIVYGPGEIIPTEDITNAGAIIFATRNAHRGSWQMDYLKEILTISGDRPVIVLATLTPYELLTTPPGPKVAYMCSFEYTSIALETSASVIFGELVAHGRSPVSIGS